MEKSGASSVAAWFLLAMVVVLVAEVHETAAVSCDESKLEPCLGAVMGTSPEPSADCCTNLKEQQPCFCDFMKDPLAKPYINSPNVKKVAADCGVTIPTCN